MVVLRKRKNSTSCWSIDNLMARNDASQLSSDGKIEQHFSLFTNLLHWSSLFFKGESKKIHTILPIFWQRKKPWKNFTIFYNIQQSSHPKSPRARLCKIGIRLLVISMLLSRLEIYLLGCLTSCYENRKTLHKKCNEN